MPTVTINNNTQIQRNEATLSTPDQTQIYLVDLYKKLSPRKHTKEIIDKIGRLIQKSIVRNITFIDNENTCGLSKEAINKTCNYPSFWKPDLTKKRVYNKIFLINFQI